jgi:Glycosyltransferases involved in cell wall biogenesis
MKCSKVSIITPCLNSEKTIRDTIESVLNQTYKNIEYIIVDGGSTDNTIRIIEEYIPLFQGRMRYISEKDKGIYDAMNKGIKMSKGCLIGIINSDDYYEDTTVEKVVRRYCKNSEQVIYGYLGLLLGNNRIRIQNFSHKNLHQNMIPHPTCFVSRKVYQKYGLFRKAFKITADYELMVRLYEKNVEFIQIPEVLANFRVGGASSSNRTLIEKSTVKLLYRYISLKEYINLLRGMD